MVKKSKAWHNAGLKTFRALVHFPRIMIKISGGRNVFLKFFGNLPAKTRKLEFYIRLVETRTTNISGGNNPRFVIHVAHVSWHAGFWRLGSHCYSHTFPEFYYHLHGMMQFHAYTVAFYTPCFCTVVELVGVLQCAIDWTTVQKVIKRHCTVVYVYYPLTVENFVKYCVYCI